MKNDLKHELTTDLRNMFEEIASQLLLKAGNMLGAGKGYSAVARDDDVKSLREGRLTAPPATGVSKPAGDDLLVENDDVDGSDDEKMSNKEIFASRRGRRGASSLTTALRAQQHIVQKDKSMVKGEGKKKAAADKLAAATAAAAAAPAEEKDQKDLQKDVALW